MWSEALETFDPQKAIREALENEMWRAYNPPKGCDG